MTSAEPGSQARGIDLPPAWAAAFSGVPRELFIPETIWIEHADEPGWFPLSRAAEPDAWRKAVHSDGYVVTQVDDGRPVRPGQAGDYSTSSASQPSLVLRMLAELDVHPGHRVLEIGTGAGYNAALLCARLGDQRVTTIEVDGDLAEAARKRLAEAGFNPAVVTGDGARGWPDGAPYDRVIATCAVRRIPWAWIEQTRPDGVVLTPFGNAYHNDGLVRLTVRADGTAAGPVVGDAAFMWLRDQRVLLGRLRDYVHDGDVSDRTTTGLDPRAMFGDPAADFAVGVQVPDVSWHRFDAATRAGEFTVWLLSTDETVRSWASIDYEGASPCRVEQYGPRRLWDEVEGAYRWWDESGRPGRERFGVTVTQDRQYVWLDTPGTPVTSGTPS